jgi:hypothetical protein
VNTYPGCTLTQVTGADGAANTLMMSHKALPPSWYNAAGFRMADGSWSYEMAAHERSPIAVCRDAEGNAVNIPASDWPDNAGMHSVDGFFGSPHPGSMPSLYADGGVRALAYSTDGDVLQRLWAWNDGVSLPQGE